MTLKKILKCIEITPKNRPILWWSPKNIFKIFIPPKLFIFLKTPKNIEIQNFETKKMSRAYVCMKISEYPPRGWLFCFENRQCYYVLDTKTETHVYYHLWFKLNLRPVILSPKSN